MSRVDRREDSTVERTPTPLPHEAYLGALASLPMLGSTSLRHLLAQGSPLEVWDRIERGRISRSLLEALPQQVRAAARTWPAAAADIDPDRLWRRWSAAGIGVGSLGAPAYPPCLVSDPDPPVLLFHRGDPDVLAAPRVAVIGTRRATTYGRRVAAELGRDLAAAGVCVVSGLALGIDAAAHRGSLGSRAAAGPAAVVGGGVDAPGPVANADLAREVIARGVVLSEVPPRTAPAPWRFPVRNRILAGLAQVVVVVESAATGGSLSTVEQAQLRDRAVLAVPGPVGGGASEGTNRLIADGAGVCTGVEDVLVALGLGGAGVVATDAAVEPREAPRGDAALVLHAIGHMPTSVEALARDTGLGVVRLSAALGELERGRWAERRGPFVERIARTGSGGPPR